MAIFAPLKTYCEYAGITDDRAIEQIKAGRIKGYQNDKGCRWFVDVSEIHLLEKIKALESRTERTEKMLAALLKQFNTPLERGSDESIRLI